MNKVEIIGLVVTVVLETRFDHGRFLEKLRPMFHQCGDKQGSQPDQLWGVPLSLVCDGKVDCHTASDEESCGYIGERVCRPGVFQCNSGQCVPLEARCDLLVDCQDHSDEDGCELNCQHKECMSGQCLPKPWFHDGQMDCRDGDDEGAAAPNGDTCVFICNRTKCVTNEMLNNSIVDCVGPEGPLDETLGALETFKSRARHEHISFVDKWAPKCV